MSKVRPCKYEFDRVVKPTRNQIKKHFTQFTQKENIILSTLVSSIDANNVKFSRHANNHIPFMSHNILRQILENCTIIEFNVTEESPRVLIRSKKQLNIIVGDNYELAHICAVIGIKDNTLITAYANLSDDMHQNTLNMNRYSENLDILEYAFRN